METITGLFLAICQESKGLVLGLKIPPHLTHIQALAPGWKGQCFKAAQDQPCRMYHSLPETEIKIPDKPH